MPYVAVSATDVEPIDAFADALGRQHTGTTNSAPLSLGAPGRIPEPRDCGARMVTTWPVTGTTDPRDRRRRPHGCGRVDCASEICRGWVQRRRTRAVWANHLQPLAERGGGLLRLGVTLPGDLHPLVTRERIPEMRKLARLACETVLRQVLRVSHLAQLGVVELFHPADDDDPRLPAGHPATAWRPHCHVLVSTLTRTNGQLVHLPEITDAVRAELHAALLDAWRAAVAAWLGVAVAAVVLNRDHGVYVSDVATDHMQQRAIVREEVRSWPGWLLPSATWIPVYSGMLGTRVWRDGAVLPQPPQEADGGLSFAPATRGDGTIVLPYGYAREVRLPLAQLPTAHVLALVAAEVADGIERVTDEERTWVQHRTTPGLVCVCAGCRYFDGLRAAVPELLSRAREAARIRRQYIDACAAELGEDIAADMPDVPPPAAGPDDYGATLAAARQARDVYDQRIRELDRRGLLLPAAVRVTTERRAARAREQHAAALVGWACPAVRPAVREQLRVQAVEEADARLVARLAVAEERARAEVRSMSLRRRLEVASSAPPTRVFRLAIEPQAPGVPGIDRSPLIPIPPI